jgi:quinoprotein glucose dehydrogenase
MTLFKNRLLKVLAVVAAVSLTSTAFSQTDWRSVGNDPGGMRFSPLKEITPSNVTKLVRAWTYDSGDPSGTGRGWAITPLVVNNVMYFGTTGGKAVALNATTGAEIWKFDLKTVTDLGRFSSRGIAYWPGDAQNPPRILAGTSDGLLLQLDAKTGKPVLGAGDNGVIDLKVGITEKFGGGGYNIIAPPAVYKDLAIVIPSTGEQGRYGIPGDPRAFNLKTGKEVWRFHTVPQPGEPGFPSWGMDGWQDRRGPGAWVPMTVDVPNHIIFIPLGNPTDQNFGNSRPGLNLYSDSLIALDAETGKLKWYFQMTHHDVFDWDANSPPTFIEVNKNGSKIPGIAQMTKQGLLFVFNRLTGEPIYGVEERPVPQWDALGDKVWPTQPFPVKPEPLSRVSMKREEVNKLTPESEKSCKEQFDKAVNMGPYTPYGVQPSLVFPSSEGGGSWSGASFDPTLGYIFTNTRSVGTLAILQPSVSSGVMPSFAKQKIPFNAPDGLPCNAPPWGELMAVNAATGDVVWRVPLGEYKELTKEGFPKTGTVNAGGPILTAGGVLFIGATADKTFRAFDSRTGKELWSVELENNAVATPLTYQGSNGKQFVAIVAGGGLTDFSYPPRQGKPNNSVVAVFTLP